MEKERTRERGRSGAEVRAGDKIELSSVDKRELSHFQKLNCKKYHSNLGQACNFTPFVLD
jgi:hypothetical protein